MYHDWLDAQGRHWSGQAQTQRYCDQGGTHLGLPAMAVSANNSWVDSYLEALVSDSLC